MPAVFFALIASLVPALAAAPYEQGRFAGRIAYSCDGNHNDPDDWIASPVTLAILAESGLRDRLVHFDYNSILPQTKPDWEAAHAASVLGAAERYGYDRARFFDDRRDLEGSIGSLVAAINASSREDPLYLIVAGPMEVPVRAMQKCDRAKLRWVTCISHSRWNDGFQSGYTFSFTKRSVIELGVRWVQIADQNQRLSLSRYGKPAQPEEFAGFFWMRDSADPKVRFLWERMQASTRPDPSDAGMAWFLTTGDEECTPAKLKTLIAEHRRPAHVAKRPHVRLEAENFRFLEGFGVDDRNDRQASHRLSVKAVGTGPARIRTNFDEPYAPATGTFDVEVRYKSEKGTAPQFALLVNGRRRGERWRSGGNFEWSSHVARGVTISAGDELRVDVEGGGAWLDFVQLNLRGPGEGVAAASPEMRAGGRRSQPLDDPDAMPGGLIVAGANPGYLKYNGGGPVFLCGPDNPEEFLYLGSLNPDGTRTDGGQSEMIARMAQAGVNAFHCIVFRMQRCNLKQEGDDAHCPFVDHDPAKPLNEAVLAQWDGWLTELERAGINVDFEFYNDATDVEKMGWKLDERGELHPDERRFITGIVERFKHHKNILWCIEESCNKLPRTRTPHFQKIGALIASTDNFHHPIAQSFVIPEDPEGDFPPGGLTTDDYAGDPNIRVITWLHVRPNAKDYERQHAEYLRFAEKNRRRFVAMKNETFHHPRSGESSRRYMWSCAMTGLHTMEAYHHAGGPKPSDDATLGDDGRLRRFMERTDFFQMVSQDALAAGSTKWVLARPGQSYIAYTYDYSGPMGVKDLSAGTYDLLWYDPRTGEFTERNGVVIPDGSATWPKPANIGNEVALYLERTGDLRTATASAR